MALYVLKNDGTELSVGETKVLNKLKYLYQVVSQDAFLYIKPKIGRLVPDFLLIDSLYGICIVEANDAGRDELLSVVAEDNPITQTKIFLELAAEILPDFSDNIFAHTVLMGISMQDIEDCPVLSEVSCITSDTLSLVSIATLFNGNEIELDEGCINLIKTTLFPEMKVYATDEAVQSLDIEQENFIRR